MKTTTRIGSSEWETQCRTQLSEQEFSNDLLPDRDQQLVRELLVEAEKSIIALDSDGPQTFLGIQLIQERRMDILALIKRLRVGIAPHKKVPAEVLAKIFVYCAKMDSDILRLPPRYYNSVWNIIQVSSRWRKIGMAEPLLWNKLGASPVFKTDALNAMIHDIFLNRGGQGPIEYHPPPINIQREWDDVSSLLSAYPSRLQNLTLVFGDCIPLPLAAPQSYFNNLKSVKLSFGYSNALHDFENRKIEAFSTAHNLRKAIILSSEDNIRLFSSWPNCISLPWAQLTDLTLSVVPASILSKILGYCYHLSVCTLGVQDGLLDDTPNNRTIRLEFLESVFITSNSDNCAAVTILDILVVPALKGLVFAQPDWVEWPQNSVLNLIKRSVCSLEMFETPEDALGADEVVPLMRAMPQLTKFSAFTNEPMSERTLDVITSERLCPHLRKLRGWQVPSIRPFAQFLQSRWEGPRKGICSADVTVPEDVFCLEKQYYESIVPELEIGGRKITINPYYHY